MGIHCSVVGVSNMIAFYIDCNRTILDLLAKGEVLNSKLAANHVVQIAFSFWRKLRKRMRKKIVKKPPLTVEKSRKTHQLIQGTRLALKTVMIQQQDPICQQMKILTQGWAMEKSLDTHQALKHPGEDHFLRLHRNVLLNHYCLQ